MLMRLWILFVCICFLSSMVESIPVTWHRKMVRIYNCDSVEDFYVHRVRNLAFVKAEPASVIHGWVQFSNSRHPYRRMYGTERNGQWYFMEERNGRIRLVPNHPPTGFVSLNDPRYFSNDRRSHDGKSVWTHLATQTVVHIESFFLRTTTNPELATNICLQPIEV